MTEKSRKVAFNGAIEGFFSASRDRITIEIASSGSPWLHTMSTFLQVAESMSVFA